MQFSFTDLNLLTAFLVSFHLTLLKCSERTFPACSMTAAEWSTTTACLSCRGRFFFNEFYVLLATNKIHIDPQETRPALLLPALGIWWVCICAKYAVSAGRWAIPLCKWCIYPIHTVYEPWWPPSLLNLPSFMHCAFVVVKLPHYYERQHPIFSINMPLATSNRSLSWNVCHFSC